MANNGLNAENTNIFIQVNNQNITTKPRVGRGQTSSTNNFSIFNQVEPKNTCGKLPSIFSGGCHKPQPPVHPKPPVHPHKPCGPKPVSQAFLAAKAVYHNLMGRINNFLQRTGGASGQQQTPPPSTGGCKPQPTPSKPSHPSKPGYSPSNPYDRYMGRKFGEAYPSGPKPGHSDSFAAGLRKEYRETLIDLDRLIY